MTIASAFQTLAARLSRFRRQSKGNVALVSALVAVPITLATGMGLDYGMTTFTQDQINGFADAAALSAVTPNMMSTKSATQSAAAAKANFLAQLSTLQNVTYVPGNISVTASDTTNGTVIQRTVTISYQASTQTMFGGLVGLNTLNFSGSATSVSSTAPNINFWMLLDDSPSMAIAATQADINTMVAHTANQGGCAFACHEVNPSADNLGNPGGEDNYALARNLGVTLRIDNVNKAVQSLMSTAATTSQTYNTTYQFVLYTMDFNTNPVGSYGSPSVLSSSQISNLSISALEVYNQSCVTPTNCNNDTDSYLDAGLNYVNGKMPNPGNGTNNPGDTPQEVLFIVSDGVTDYINGSRRMSPINTDYNYCSTIKNRGIRIAFLYLTYYPLTTNSFYNGNIAPWQPQIATDAQACASPGLYFEVSTGGDITAAMTTLFQRAVATAHLQK